MGNAGLRLIGVKGALYYENGDFTRFRRIAAEQDLISGVTRSQFAYNISMSSGYEFKFKKSSFGFDATYGITRFIAEDPAFFTCSLNAHYTYKRYSTFLQFTESFVGIGEEYTVGLAYRLK